MPLFEGTLFVASKNRKVKRYIEATSPQAAISLLEGCFDGMAELSSVKKVENFDINGYIVIPSSKAIW